MISSIFESYLGLCLGHSLTHSLSHSLCPQFFLPNERENILVSSVFGSVEIKYSSQILQFCSKLGWSFRHSVSFQCLFKLRNFYYNYFVSCHLFLYLNWTNISLMDTSLVFPVIERYLTSLNPCIDTKFVKLYIIYLDIKKILIKFFL